MHVKITNGVPEKYTIGQLRRDNPQVSFPKTIPDEILADYDVYPLKQIDRPQVDHTKNVDEGVPIQIDGTWTQVWDITDATSEQVAERTDERAQSVRSERNQKLANCDWTQLSDAPVDATVWASYRQELRDISSQPGFPWEITWPVEP